MHNDEDQSVQHEGFSSVNMYLDQSSTKFHHSEVSADHGLISIFDKFIVSLHCPIRV